MILLGILTSAHGIQGAIKVKSFTQDPASLFSYGALKDEKGNAYRLKLIRVMKDILVVSIEGVKTRNDAEKLRGTKLFIERAQLPDLADEEFYHEDLINLPVQTGEGTPVGRVQAVNNFGAGDFLEIVDDHYHIFTIPFTKEAVPLVKLGDFIQVDERFLLDAAALPEDGEEV